ncbi:ABC transporter ATP-binding protein [Ihubacter sp. rT4E-8]|uniref:ABC transporter ATP-binding protein n=1 Tax=Ihubacter sp. rT4E-8 TaxID=3242369 RepID=UPI003CE6EA8A
MISFVKEFRRINLIVQKYSYNKSYLLCLILSKIVFEVIELLPPLLYLVFIKNVIEEGNATYLKFVVIGYCCVFLAESLFKVLLQVIENKISCMFELKIQCKILESICRNPNSEFDTGELKQRVEDDVQQTVLYINDYTDYLVNLLGFGIVVLIMLKMSILFTMISLILIPISFLCTKYTNKKITNTQVLYREKYAEYEDFLFESLRSFREIKSNRLEQECTERFDSFWKALSGLFIRNHIYWFLNRGFIAFKDVFLTKMALFFIGGIMVIQKIISVSILLVFMDYYEKLTEYILSMTDLNAQLVKRQVSIKKVQEFLEKEHNTTKSCCLNGNIVLKHVSHKYENEMVIEDCSFTIKEHSYTAIVGASGEGKSTIARIILGIEPIAEGKIIVGNTNINNYDRYYSRKNMGAVLQNSGLFNVSIRENLLFGNPNATEQQIWDACKNAQIAELILALPEKLDTLIGEKGIKLSGGQKQRLLLARVFLQKNSYLILDEAVSALDSNTEHVVMKNIIENNQHQTLLIISHKLSSIIDADDIILFHDHKVVTRGTHKQLIANSTLYKQLWETQIGGKKNDC